MPDTLFEPSPLAPRRSPEEQARDRDLGFGSVVSRDSRQRLLNRDGSFNVVRAGLSFFDSFAPYHLLLTTSWTGFFAAVVVSYFLVNVVFAVAFVASPFYVRPAIAAFESLDRSLLDAARTLGAHPARVFARVALPLAGGALAASGAVAFARGLGEFGATIMFAGSLQGVTQTLPLAIYAEFARDFHVAIALGALLVVISFAILLSIKLVPAWTRYVSTSTFRSATSS